MTSAESAALEMDPTPGQRIARALSAVETYSVAGALLGDVDRFREHSVTLNTVCWKIAAALGDIPPGATEIDGKPVEQADRLIAERDRLLAEVETLCGRATLMDQALTERGQQIEQLRADLANTQESANGLIDTIKKLAGLPTEIQRVALNDLAANLMTYRLADAPGGTPDEH